jgi:hypothetical protein
VYDAFDAVVAYRGLRAALAGSPAWAQQPTPHEAPPPDADKLERAKALKAQGDAAMDSGRPADAIIAYSAAYELSADPALLYNRGRALQALTEYPRALDELERFDREAPADLKAKVPKLGELIAELRQKVTTLTVVCSVQGARVLLREKALTSCPPPGPMRVNAGPATIEASAEGYFPFKRDVVLPGGGIATIDVTMTSKTTSGILVVQSPVVGTRVTVDDAPAGVVPVEITVGAGSHVIRLSKDGYHGAQTAAVVGAGERKIVNVPLEKETPIYAKWWFWTGIAVVVAGGVVAVVALNTEKDPTPGTIAPGIVPAGAFRF